MRSLPLLLLGPRDFRELTHVYDRGLAKFFTDHRQQPMPRAIAKEGNVSIRRILAPALTPLAQKFLQCSASEGQQRPHYLAKRVSLVFENDSRMNSRESSNAGTAKNAQQDRLRLDTGTDAGRMTAVNRRLTSMQFQSVLPRQLRDKPLVLVRLFSAQLVIDMRNRQHGPQLGAQLQQQAKQSHGLRSAANRHRQAVPRPNRLLPPNCLQ